MKRALVELAKRFLALRGHSLLLFAAAVALFAASSFVPNGLAWVFRVIGFVMLAFVAWRAATDLSSVTEWLVRGPLEQYAKLSAWLGRRTRFLVRFESILAAAVILLAGVHFGQTLVAMSRASLRVDEIGSVRSYAGRGPFVSMTTYNLAKNHIFFSVVNSLTPGASSLHPLRARFWSFVSVGAAVVVLAIFFWRLGSPLAAAVAFAIPALNPIFLTKVFEARGYGFLALAAACGLVAFHRFLRSGRQRDLWILGVSTALGTWTLPFYVVFGGCLLALLYAMRPCRQTFIAGAASLLAIGAFYAPVIVQFSQVAGGYDEKYGSVFESIESVFGAMSFAVPFELLRVDGVVFLAVVLLVMALPLVLRRSTSADSKTLQIAAILVILFYLFCLVLGSPPRRITAFLATPIAFVCGMLVYQLLTHRGLLPFRPLLGLAIAGALLLGGKATVAGFSFEPDQRWREAAAAIRSLHPAGAVIWTPDYRNMLAAHLDNQFRVEEGLPAEADLVGTDRLLFDPAHKDTHPTTDVESLFPHNAWAAVRFPLRGSPQQVLYVPVNQSNRLEPLSLDGIPVAMPISIRGNGTTKFKVQAAPSTRSINMVFAKSVEKIQILAAASDGIPIQSVKRIANLVVISLDEGYSGSSIEFSLHGESDKTSVIEEIWATRSIPESHN